MNRDLLYPGGRTGPKEPQLAGLHEGIVRKVTAQGVRFVIPEFDPQYVFGPAPYTKVDVLPKSGGAGDDAFASHDHDVATPPVGAKCLVAFVGLGIDRPWVVGWWTQ